MVDQDRFTRTAAAGWASSARAVRDTWAVDLLGRQLERDVYRALRSRGGLRDSLLIQCVQDAERFAPRPELHVDVLSEALAAYVWDRCLGPLIPLMIGADSVFDSVDEAEAYCRRALDAAQLDVAAERLLRRPEAGPGLKRPARRPLSTRELLDEDMPVAAPW